MKITDPIEVLKYCPKCGSVNFKKECDRWLKCSDCGFHFFINSAAAVAALVVNDKGKLMLVTRGVEPNYGKLDLPGGFIDPGESAENAIKRELMEELGLKVKTLKYIGSAPNEYIFSEFLLLSYIIKYYLRSLLTSSINLSNSFEAAQLISLPIELLIM